jgi:hypothetical protein
MKTPLMADKAYYQLRHHFLYLQKHKALAQMLLRCSQRNNYAYFAAAHDKQVCCVITSNRQALSYSM